MDSTQKTISGMPALLKLQAVGGASILAVSGAFLVKGSAPGTLLALLLFALPILWGLWIAYVVREFRAEIWKQALLWVLIDVSALAVLSLSAISAREMAGPRGDDVALAIAFAPVFLPVLLVTYLLPPVGHMLLAVTHWLLSNFAFLSARHVLDWATTSLLSAIPSLVLVIAVRAIRGYSGDIQGQGYSGTDHE